LPAALSSGAKLSSSQPQAQERSSATKQGPLQQPGHARSAAGTVWVDPTMDEWPSNDFRIFVGDLAVDATEEELTDAFKKYASFNMARVVMDKRTGESKGYGFVSFAKGEDMVKALREMNGKYVGTRPVKLKKSNWQKKELTSDRKSDLKFFRSTGLIAKRRSKTS
jgi:RNA recognition motif-containing protein